MKSDTYYTLNFKPGDEDGVLEADESMDPKNCLWWPSEALDKSRYPFYAMMHGKAFLPYVMKEVKENCWRRLLISSGKTGKTWEDSQDIFRKWEEDVP